MTFNRFLSPIRQLFGFLVLCRFRFNENNSYKELTKQHKKKEMFEIESKIEILF